MAASPDDASWMFVLLSGWAQNSAFMVFTRRNIHDVASALVAVRSNQQKDPSSSNVLPATMAGLMSDGSGTAAVSLFNVIDAMFLELEVASLGAFSQGRTLRKSLNSSNSVLHDATARARYVLTRELPKVIHRSTE